VIVSLHDDLSVMSGIRVTGLSHFEHGWGTEAVARLCWEPADIGGQATVRSRERRNPALWWPTVCRSRVSSQLIPLWGRVGASAHFLCRTGDVEDKTSVQKSEVRGHIIVKQTGGVPDDDGSS